MTATTVGKVCSIIGRLISDHVDSLALGHVIGNDTWIRTRDDPDVVRGADICFYRHNSRPEVDAPPGTGAADLLIAVRSPSERPIDLMSKMVEHLRAGVRVVVILDPVTATVFVYRDDQAPQMFRNGDSLTLPDVLPGFSVRVDQLFA